jgi:hypothetical protein
VTFQLAAVGNQRTVGGDLRANAVFFEDALGAQHFLDLVAHRHLIFELQGEMLAQADGTRFLVCHDIGAKFLAHLGVLLQAHQALAGDGWHAFLPLRLGSQHYVVS